MLLERVIYFLIPFQLCILETAQSTPLSYLGIVVAMSLPIPSWLNVPAVAYNPPPVLNSAVTTNSSLFMICALVKDEDLYIDEWL